MGVSRRRSESPRLDALRRAGIPAGADNREVVATAEVIILAVKPQSMAVLLAEIKPLLSARHLVVSIAAGIKGFPWSLPFNSSIARLVRPCGPCLLFTVLAEFCQMTRVGQARLRSFKLD